MDKGILFIPVNNQEKKNDILFDEIISETIDAEKWGIKEVFFGEHITDKHEKISSSLMKHPITSTARSAKLNLLHSSNINGFDLIVGISSGVGPLVTRR